MSDLISRLREESFWNEFYEYKTSKGFMRKSDREDFELFITEKQYVDVVRRIDETLDLSYPKMSLISKSGTDKKRVVFTYNREENYVLKGLTYLLKKYDNYFCSNLYSFRSNTGVKHAIEKVINEVDFKNTYSYKVDIHDYFNSIDIQNIIDELSDVITDDARTFTLLSNLLSNTFVEFDKDVIEVKKGIMAGVPFSGFLANIYLTKMDRFFEEKNIAYIRYSDDIICFAQSEELIAEYEAIIKGFIIDKKLEINPKKELRTTPNQSVEFLGFIFDGKTTDVSEMSVKKIKAKMKRKARALYRWRLNKELGGREAARAFIKFINRKFYKNPVRGEITWSRWYFPVINTPKSLELIDDYAVDCIRFLYTGNYGKKNYNLRYEEIQKLGFKSLVNSYWKFKNGDDFES